MDKYIILDANTAEELARLVEEKIKAGYEPIGGPILHIGYNGDDKFMQALSTL